MTQEQNKREGGSPAPTVESACAVESVRVEEPIRIGVDVAGSESGTEAVLEGVRAALEAVAAGRAGSAGVASAAAGSGVLGSSAAPGGGRPLEVHLIGPAEVVEAAAEGSQGRIVAHAAEQVIGMDEHPVKAIRSKKDSSIVVGARLLKEGHIDAFYSAGSTGALLAAGIFVTGRAAGVERPGLFAVLPAPAGPLVFGDTGANADCKPATIAQFGRMGELYARAMLGLESPRVGLLNIGAEEAKGSLLAREAYELMDRGMDCFAGNCEGKDLLTGSFDVVVTDGFTGNVALKSMEGALSMILREIKSAFLSSARGKAAALLAKPALMDVKRRLSSDEQGAAVLLGLKAPILVGHGSSGPRATECSIYTAMDMVATRVSDAIADALAADAAAEIAASAAEAALEPDGEDETKR